MVFFLSRPKKDFFTPVEYIESSGTQYIDTEFYPNQDTRVLMDVCATQGGTYTFFAARRNANSDSYSMFEMSQSQVRFDYGNTRSTINVSTALERVLIDFNKNVFSFGTYNSQISYQTFQVPVTLYLLGVNQIDGFGTPPIPAKLYSCKIYDNGVLVRDYIPAKDKNGVGCLYDKVNAKLVYSSGTSQFTVGPEV